AGGLAWSLAGGLAWSSIGGLACMPHRPGIGGFGARSPKGFSAATFSRRDLSHGAARCNPSVLREAAVRGGAGQRGTGLGKEPVVALAAVAALHAHQHPAAPELVAGEGEFQLALA